MIPYEDLVVALQTWRARQGLPVTQLSGSMTPPPQVAAPPPRQAAPPPAKPPTPKAAPVAPPPLGRPSEDSLLDVEDASLLDEEHFGNEGDNFALKFGDAHAEDDSTAIGSAPPRPSDGFGALTDPNPLDTTTEELPDPKKSIRTTNRNDDW